MTLEEKCTLRNAHATITKANATTRHGFVSGAKGGVKKARAQAFAAQLVEGSAQTFALSWKLPASVAASKLREPTCGC